MWAKAVNTGELTALLSALQGPSDAIETASGRTNTASDVLLPDCPFESLCGRALATWVQGLQGLLELVDPPGLPG
jgi:hypothetical protein